MLTYEELYERFQMLGRKYQQLGRIVKSSEQSVTHEELDEFEQNIDRILVEMQKMKNFVISHYQRENKIDN